MIPWQDVSMLGYCVLNPESSVAQLTESKTDLATEDIIAYGRLAQRLFSIPSFYIEYSGALGDLEKVASVYQSLKNEGSTFHLFYGGGISNKSVAQQMKQVADTIVIGNIIYEDIQAALDTVNIKEEK